MPLAARVHGIKTQAAHAREAIVLRLFHLSLPVFAWLGLAVLALMLRLAFPGAGTAAAVAGAGLCLAVLDHHLRSHRQSWLGRWIGPATAAAAAGWLAAVVLTGWSRPVLFVYVVGGLPGCLGWILWMAHGDHHDLSRAFTPAAETAFGVLGSRLTRIRHKRSAVQPAAAQSDTAQPATGRPAAARHATTTATIQFPPGEFVTKDAAVRLEYLEAALGYEAGSFSLTNNPRGADAADVSISSPRLLTAAPLRWPGPSAPGADMSVPFRLGVLQDGREFLYSRLPIGHRKVTGVTDSGKSMSLAWNMLAEGITREGYAAFAADPVKGSQFLGPLRGALHRFEAEPEAVLDMLAGLHRARRARCDFLARIHATEWYPGCGLSFLEVWLEEAPGVLRLLGKTAKDRSDGRFMLEDWVEDVTAARSAGISVTASYNKPDKTQAFSTVARSQMGHVCFGVNDSDDAEFGLSDLQRERGCRPQLWGASYPGMAFWDCAAVPEKDKTMAMRHYFWGPGSEHIAAYASAWPASRRKLDDVTGEALEARPARPASSAFPVRQDTAALEPARQRRPRPEPAGQQRIRPEEAVKRIRAQLAAWRLDGTQFTVRQLINALGHGVVCPRGDCTNQYCTGRSRAWLYGQVGDLVKAGVLAEPVTDPGKPGSPATYAIAGDPEGEPA